MKEITVNEIMIRKITVAGKQHKFSQILEFFNLFNIRHLPVTENDELLGIISIRDILKLMHEKLASGESLSLLQLDAKYNAENIMTSNPVTVSAETPLEEALSLLSSGGFHALPVVEGNKIKGIVTEHDLLVAYNKEKHPPQFYESDSPGYGI